MNLEKPSQEKPFVPNEEQSLLIDAFIESYSKASWIRKADYQQMKSIGNVYIHAPEGGKPRLIYVNHTTNHLLDAKKFVLPNALTPLETNFYHLVKMDVSSAFMHCDASENFQKHLSFEHRG